MDGSQWVIAASTAVIAIVFLVLAVILIKALVTLRKDIHLLSESVDRKIQALLGFPSSDSRAVTHESSQRLPWLLRGLVFATALWKNLHKRR